MNPQRNPRGDHFFTREERLGEPGGEPDFTRFRCNHPKSDEPVTVNVLGWALKIVIPDQVPMCRSCFEVYLNTHSTLCGCCGKPILPGERVAEAPYGTTAVPNEDPNRSGFKAFVQPIVDWIRAFVLVDGHGGMAERTVRVNYRIVHRSLPCAGYLDRFCGIWGEGRLISLHELMPDEVPPGTRTMTGLNFALNEGEHPIFVGFGSK